MSTETIRPFKGQDYESLRADCNEDNLFEDDEFPATMDSLYYSKSAPGDIQWLRPKEACENPQFVVNEFNRCDMDQGYVGNCWFIAGAVGIMQNPKMFAKVVPQDQSFEDNYGGIFHFRFWLYGEWVDVVVDDRLPYWSDGTLVYCKNKQEPNEYWSPLLEKAYAKVYGTYESLDAGQTYDALVDMSGGIQEQFAMDSLSGDERDNFWTFICKGFEKDCIIGCSISPDPSVREARMDNGLVRGHAYTVTKVIDLNGEQLIRIRNPWGNEVEWNGAWSDQSEEWNSLGEDERAEVGLEKEHDGEFWMSLSDFMREWSHVQICHLSANSFSDELLETDNDDDLYWKVTKFHSKWEPGSTAGGCGREDPATFWTNPQFLVQLFDVDKDDNEDKATVIVSLMQKDSRLKRMQTGNDSCEEYIQFKLFKINDDVEVDENKTTGLRLYSGQLERIGTSGSYINAREVTKRFRVDPGNYLIIPSTYDADRECEFLIRTFTETLNVDGGALEEHKGDLDDEDVVIEPCDDDNIMDYVSLLDPKVFKSKFVEWAKRGEFGFKDGRATFGDENLNFGAGSSGGVHSFNANFAGKSFGVSFGEGGFKFNSPWS